jgi:hypothetical protein
MFFRGGIYVFGGAYDRYLRGAKKVFNENHQKRSINIERQPNFDFRTSHSLINYAPQLSIHEVCVIVCQTSWQHESYRSSILPHFGFLSDFKRKWIDPRDAT